MSDADNEFDRLADPAGTWARAMIREARREAKRTGRTVEVEALRARVGRVGFDKCMFPPNYGLGHAFQRVLDLLDTLPESELLPLEDTAGTPEHERAARWAAAVVLAERIAAEQTGVSFPYVVLIGPIIPFGRRVFPTVDIDALVIAEAYRLEPLDERPEPT